MNSTTTTRAWYWAGSAIIGSSVAAFALPAQIRGGGLIASVLFGIGLLLLAFGGGVNTNIIRGDKLGTGAMVLLAVWGVGITVLNMATSPLWDPTFSVVLQLVTLAFAFAVAIQFVRATHLPRQLRWAPMIALAAYAALWALGQIVVVSTIGSTFGVVAAMTLGVVMAAIPIVLGVFVLLHAQSQSTARAEIAEERPSAS